MRNEFTDAHNENGRSLAPQGHIKSVCVFCGSRPGNDTAYMEMAEQAGRLLAQNGYRLVYGSGTRGMMGAVAKGAKKAGGQVLGINVHMFVNHQGVAPEGAEEIRTETMFERKQKMIHESDAFLILPGGIGTIDEGSEVSVWNDVVEYQNNEAIIKPVIFVNYKGFYEGMLLQMDTSLKHGFTNANISRYYGDVPSVADAIRMLNLLNKQGPVQAASRYNNLLLPHMLSQFDPSHTPANGDHHATNGQSTLGL